MTAPACPLCEGEGGRLVLRTRHWRLIHAAEPGYPGFYRLVWNEHVAEYSDLDPGARSLCMDAVCTVEALLRHHLQPRKMNIASLGNQVPHLHWHVIARFEWDAHFPAPVWAPPVRQAPVERLLQLQARLPALEDALRARLSEPSV